MSHWTPDYSFQQFETHRGIIASAAGTNEATTRIRAINTLLFQVLGWDTLDVDAETYSRAVGFADYTFRIEGAIRLILEAKRDGDTFLLPEATFPSSPSVFALLSRECPAAENALRQAISYAAGFGAPLVAITNGHQWLIALTFEAGTPIQGRLVFVFESLDAIANHFRQFWKTFSPAGIASNRVLDTLRSPRKAPPPAKLSRRLALYPEPARRNHIAHDLSTILGAIWEDLRHDEDELEFLRNCYVQPDPSASALALAKELLEQKLSSDERAYAAPLKPGDVPDMITAYSPERPIVVLGNVGSGKSIFLRKLRKLDAAGALDKYIQLDLDFIDRPASASEVPEFIYARIEEQLQRPPHAIDLMDDSLIRGSLNADLNRFRRSPEAGVFGLGTPEFERAELSFINSIRADRHEFLRRVFAHLRGARQFSVALFFDNLDRRQSEIQEEAYLRASAIARDWSCLVFVCLRPSTFYQSGKNGVLDSVAPKLITITSPPAEHVLVRRLRFGIRYAIGTSPPSGARAPLGSTFAFEMPEVALFLECLMESFRHNAALGAFFEAVSNGNTRDLLKYTYQVITSLHFNTGEVVEKYRGDNKYRIPVHHALRALLYGDYLHYDPKKSRFINLFDIQQASPEEHFTRLVVLQLLATVPRDSPTYGFARLSYVVQHLLQAGYSNGHATWTLRLLFERQCIESRDPLEKWSDDISELRLTDLGRYHLVSLVNNFTYCDAMTVDTPILDDEAREKIVDTLKIRFRIERCLVFVDYLSEAATRVLDTQTRRLWREACERVKQYMADIQDDLDERDAEEASGGRRP
jgi:hypothetical protein